MAKRWIIGVLDSTPAAWQIGLNPMMHAKARGIDTSVIRMTSQEYYKAYTAARRRWPSLIRSGMAEIKAAYALAAEITEKAFYDASGLAAERLSSINTQLAQATATIAESLLAEVPSVVSAGQTLYGAIDEKLLGSLFAGSEAVTKAGIENMIVRINQRLIADTINRVYQDGYTLSSKCWEIGGDYQVQIKRLINSGIAQGKGTADIARSIGDYTKGGIDALDKAYTSAKYGDVVVKNVDWRALRLVRTELGASMKIGAVMQGEQNPGGTGEYDWIRINTAQHSCLCGELASGSPYKAEDVPAQPHPNCHPAGTMVLAPEGYRAIEEIKPGDIVFDHKMNKSIVSAFWKSSYTKTMHDIYTVNGEISCTDDHPILANGRWKAAKLLNPGDNLRYWPNNVISSISTNNYSDYLPSDFSNKLGFYFIEESFFRGVVPVTSVYLDGKFYIIKSKIDIEFIKSHIDNGSFPEFVESIKNLALILRLENPFDCFSPHDKTVMAKLCSSDSIVSGFGIVSMPVSMGPIDSLTLPRCAISEFMEPIGEAGSIDANNISNLLHRSFFGIKQIQNSVNVDLNPSHDVNLKYVDSPIVCVTSRKVNVIVYNITVEGNHTFIANGFASHNCACQIRPRLRDLKETTADIKRWSAGESVPYLDEWYGRNYQPSR